MRQKMPFPTKPPPPSPVHSPALERGLSGDKGTDGPTDVRQPYGASTHPPLSLHMYSFTPPPEQLGAARHFLPYFTRTSWKVQSANSLLHTTSSSISKNVIRVPMLVPGLEYSFETLVECVSDLGISDQVSYQDCFPSISAGWRPICFPSNTNGLMQLPLTNGQDLFVYFPPFFVQIRVFVVRPSSPKPVLSALINMPVAELI